MTKFTAIAALMLSTASPALALDFGNGFYATGDIELEYMDGSGFDGETIGYGSFDIGYEQAGGGFGAFVGVDAYTFDSNSESAFYGALTYSGSFGKFQVGAPRPALDDYIETPDLGGSVLYDLELSILSGSYLPIIYLGSSSIDTPVGLRYDGSFGAAKVGVSYHNVEEADIVDLGLSYQLGKVELRGGLEHINAGSTNETSYFIGAEGEIGPVVAGVLYGNIGFAGNAEATQVYATYSPLEALDLTACYLALSSSGPTQDIYGLAANYTIYQGIYVEAGYLDAGGSSDAIYNASLGLKF